MKTKTIGQAVLEYTRRNPNRTALEINAFIEGWTAHEVTIEVNKLTD